MRRKAILRGLFGIPLGISLGFMVSIIISLATGDGYFVVVAPEMVAEFSNELNAALFNTMLYAVLGCSFAAATVIWEIDNWSIARQTVTHFVISATTMLPVAWFGHWMERTAIGFIIYLVVFVVIFATMWLTQYFIWKNKINRLNQKIKAQ